VANWISVRRHGTLTVRTGKDRDSLVLQAVGEVDMASAPALEQSLLYALESGASSIVLDLNAVSFIDAAGMRVLLWATATSRRDGDRLRIDCGSPVIRRLLDITGSDPESPSTT
jgi:anti-anti-sigma factor